MPGPKPPPLTLTARQRAVLERWVRCPSRPQGLVRRARIILEAAAGANNTEIGRRVGCPPQMAQLWRGCWLEAGEELAEVEAAGIEEADLEKLLAEVLGDDPRSGAPAKFTPEQIVQIIAVACEDPQACGRPVSHWTPRELAEEVVKRGIVAEISPRSVGRFWAEAALQPHRMRYWRIAQPEDPEAFMQEAEGVCGLYQQAPALQAQGDPPEEYR